MNGIDKKYVRDKGSFYTLALTITISLLVSLIVRMYVVQLFYIPSESMENTLMVNDKVAVLKIHGDISRGDIVVFKDPGGWLDPTYTSDILIKRVVGLPGDEVSCCDTDGKLKVNGKVLNENYLNKDTKPSEVKFDENIEAGNLWVMGDNRGNSADSRFNKISQVPLENVVGIAEIKVWPTIHNL